ncbi:MAG: hypothetical protein M1824_005085 [Vezdaea acicularis]|nr:MAG: hypothetical protein M1824_005085 [Vezdaea acicularis]
MDLDIPTIVADLLLAHITGAILFLALLTPPSNLSHRQLWTALLPVIWGVHFWYCFVHCGEFTLYPSLEALVATDLLFFRTPRESFRRVGVSQKFHDFSRLRARDAPLPSPAKAANGHATTTTTSTTTTSTIGEGYPTAFLPRLKWVFDLIFATALGRLDESLRPSDFTPSTTPTGHPVRRWRARYFLKELGLCILTYLVIDAALFYSQYDAYLRQRPGATIDSPLPPFLTPYLAHSHGLVTPRSFRVALNGIAIIAIIERTWCVLDTVTSALVGLRVLGEEWNGESFEQPRFGSPRALVDSGLRGYWGSFWHQTLRGVSFPSFPPSTLTPLP